MSSEMISIDHSLFKEVILERIYELGDRYYVAYKPITILYILFIFIIIKFPHCYSCMMFVMKPMNICND